MLDGGTPMTVATAHKGGKGCDVAETATRHLLCAYDLGAVVS